MVQIEYASLLCSHCPCTEYGLQSTNSGPWNLCEGRSCEEALIQFREDNPALFEDFLKEQGREMTVEDLF